MPTLTINIAPLALAQVSEPWLPGKQPYTYQAEAQRAIRKALSGEGSRCLFLVTPTGSGKTLASYAYAILAGEPVFGVYPTNELIRDQEASLRPWIDAENDNRLLRIDSAQLDYWQAVLDLRQHATAFENLLRWSPTVLTNPDILFYAFFGLYKGPGGLSQRLFTLLGQYRMFIFDEFHLYSVKQMADVAFLVAALQTINPSMGRVFVFASATPQSPAQTWFESKLGLPTQVLQAETWASGDGRTVAHPVELALVPADLQRWRATEALGGYLPALGEFVHAYPRARIVTILDSVAAAIEVAQTARALFPERPVGEVHGLTSQEERVQALSQPFTVGTSTIEVGIDFTGPAEKDVLLFEARTASQFVQRFGRLARHEKTLPIPNRAVALVPEYVYHFFTERLTEGETISRDHLYRTVDEAYQRPEDFQRYLRTHAPAEFHEAIRSIHGLFQPDESPRVKVGLETAMQALTGCTGAQAWGLHRRYTEEKVLAPLLTFRPSGFEAGVSDERGVDAGFPIRRYSLMFLLRRGEVSELGEEEYLQRLDGLAERWPLDAARERRFSRLIGAGPEELLGVYGYFALKGILDRGRRVWFEVSQDQVRGRQCQVTVLTGLEIVTEPGLPLRRLSHKLRRKRVVAWFADRHPASIKLGHALPPLFELYELRVRRPGGALSDAKWSIAFNQDAFFLDSLGWPSARHDAAIVL